jgi:membrane protease YdiL (CAAX protease family)
MVTDWLHNPRVLMLLPLVSATLCALVLAATRKQMPPAEPRWRLVRALIVVGFWIGGWGALKAVLGWRTGMLMMPPMGLGADPWLSLAAIVVGHALFFGWLIPHGIEGRSLREMGWRRHHALRYFLIGGAITLIVASVVPVSGMPADLQQQLGVQGARPGAIIGMPIPLMWVLLYGFVLTGWTEENLFRGHLMPAFREVGLDGRKANMAQAAVFITIHIPGLIPELIRQHTEYGVVAMVAAAVIACVGWWLWGLMFGWLRMRFDSIVPGFAVHGTWNAVHVARTWIGVFVVMQWLS